MAPYTESPDILLIFLEETRLGSPVDNSPSTNKLHQFVLHYANLGQELELDMAGITLTKYRIRGGCILDKIENDIRRL